MKNTFNFSFLLILVLISTTTFSQVQEKASQNKLVKNEISFEALGLINGVYQLTYERYVWNNFSASLSLGYKGKEGLIKLSGIDTDQLKTSEVFYTGYQIAPEIRYYLKSTSKNNLDGFYFGAYLKYSNYKSSLDGSYISSENINYDLEFDMKLNVTSLGLMVGYKLPVTKHLNIDFLIAGPGSGNYNFQFKNEKDLPEEFYTDLNEALEDYSIFDLINSDFRFSDVNAKTKFSALSFRYGIAVGYTF